MQTLPHSFSLSLPSSPPPPPPWFDKRPYFETYFCTPPQHISCHCVRLKFHSHSKFTFFQWQLSLNISVTFYSGSVTVYQCGLLAVGLLSLLANLLILATSINQKKEEPSAIWLFALPSFHQLEINNISTPFHCIFSNLTINTKYNIFFWVKLVSGTSYDPGAFSFETGPGEWERVRRLLRECQESVKVKTYQPVPSSRASRGRRRWVPTLCFGLVQLLLHHNWSSQWWFWWGWWIL